MERSKIRTRKTITMNNPDELKIDLEKIIFNELHGVVISGDEMYCKDEVIEAMQEAIRQAIKNTLLIAAGNSRMIYHDGYNKIDTSITHFQSGADNLQPDKDSIINQYEHCVKTIL